MFARLTPVARLIIIALIGAGMFWGYTQFKGSLAIPGMASVTLGDMSLPTTSAPDGSVIAAKQAAPSSDVSTISVPEFRLLVWAWNAQMGEFYANGGPQTTKGSLMERRNVRLSISRQDDVPKMIADLVLFANAYKTDKNTTVGAQFIQIMGDGDAAFFSGINAELAKIGPEYTAEVIGSVGRSLGEDQLMGPVEWKTDPQKARGSLVSTVVRDGDWNIVIKWAADNGIPVNPDEKTYDPDAINFYNAATYTDAAQQYINGYEETRQIVKAGKLLGISQPVKINAVSTWTPADVTVADKKGGLATIVSTKDYRNQMASTLIGIKKHMADNAKQVENMLAAIFEGSDQVKAYPEALKTASVVANKIYAEKGTTPEYWEKYYNGETRSDKQGVTVSLGGSRVMNLADNEYYFGIAPGSTNIFAAVYKLFGDQVVKLYPKLVPSYPPIDDILNLTYLKAVSANKSKSTPTTKADKIEYHSDDNVQQTVGSRQWNILFATGSAQFTPAAYAQLAELQQGLLVSGGLRVIIEGHTDNTGSEPVNESLSNMRAKAIADYLTEKAPADFPEGRIKVVAYGSKAPIATNFTAEGRARNRRVTIKQVK